MAAALWRWQPSGAGAHRCRCPALPADAPGFSAIKWRSSLFSLSTAVPCTLKCSVNHCLPPCLFPHDLPKRSLGVNLLLFHSFSTVTLVCCQFPREIKLSSHNLLNRCILCRTQAHGVFKFEILIKAKTRNQRDEQFLFRMVTSVCDEAYWIKMRFSANPVKGKWKRMVFAGLASYSPQLEHPATRC